MHKNIFDGNDKTIRCDSSFDYSGFKKNVCNSLVQSIYKKTYKLKELVTRINHLRSYKIITTNKNF